MEYIEQVKLINKNSRLFLIGNVLSSVGFGAFFVLFNLYLQKTGISMKYIGGVNSAFSMGVAIFAFFAGVMSDRIGRKTSFIVSSSVQVAAFLFLILSRLPILLILFAFVMGSASSLFVVSQNPFLLENSTPVERPSLFSLEMTTLILGEFIGSLLGGFLPNFFGGNAIGMQKALFISLFLILCSIIPFVFIDESWEAKDFSENFLSSVKAPFVVLKNDFKRKAIVSIFVSAQFLIGLGAGFVVPFFNLYFRSRFHLSVSEIGIIFSVGSIVIAIGTLFSPFMRKKFGKLKSVVITQSSSIPFVLILAFTKNIYFAVVSFLFRGMIMNAAVPIENQLFMESIPEQSKAAISAFMQIAWNFSWGISSVISGFLMAKYGFSILFMLMLVFYISSISVLYFGLKEKIDE